MGWGATLWPCRREFVALHRMRPCTDADTSTYQPGHLSGKTRRSAAGLVVARGLLMKWMKPTDVMISSWMRRAVAVTSLTLCGGSAWALDGAASPGAGKAAAHAALRDGADVPSTPPRLPHSASDHAREALANPAVGKKADGDRPAECAPRLRSTSRTRPAPRAPMRPIGRPRPPSRRPLTTRTPTTPPPRGKHARARPRPTARLIAEPPGTRNHSRRVR